MRGLTMKAVLSALLPKKILILRLGWPNSPMQHIRSVPWWVAPPSNVKLNFDASVDVANNKCAAAMVPQDHQGTIID